MLFSKLSQINKSCFHGDFSMREKKHTFAVIFLFTKVTCQLLCCCRPLVQKSIQVINDAVNFSAAPNPAAQKMCRAMWMKTIVPRCHRPRRTRAPKPATAPLPLTAWLPGAFRGRSTTSSHPLRLSGAWRKCAALSHLFKVSVSSLLQGYCPHQSTYSTLLPIFAQAAKSWPPSSCRRKLMVKPFCC